MPRNKREYKALEPDFTNQFRALIKTPEGKQSVIDLVGVLCDIMDDMVTEEGTYMTWGMSRDGSKMCLTLHEGKIISYANAQDLAGFITEVISL